VSSTDNTVAVKAALLPSTVTEAPVLSPEDQAASDKKSLVIAVLTLVFSVPALVGS